MTTFILLYVIMIWLALNINEWSKMMMNKKKHNLSYNDCKDFIIWPTSNIKYLMYFLPFIVVKIGAHLEKGKS